MRHAKSDNSKKAAGKFQSRWSEAARAQRAIDNFLTFPQIQDVPAPSVSLMAGGSGESACYSWCERLHRNDLLTAVSEGLARIFHEGH